MKLGHALALLGLVTNVTPAAAAPRGPATSCEASLRIELATRPGKSDLAAAARKILDVSEFGASLECLPAWYEPEVTRDP